MPAFQRLLERLGFIKLDRYGLVRTPDGRIVSTRPAVLDDGTGGRVVGWQDGDLAMAELEPWRPGASAPGAPPRTATTNAAHPAAPIRAQARTPVAAATAPVMQVEVAPDAPVDEDDWEWMIALARARAEEAEGAPAAASSSPSSPASARRTTEPLRAIDEIDDDARFQTRPGMPIPVPPAQPAPPVTRSIPTASPVARPIPASSPVARPAPAAPPAARPTPASSPVARPAPAQSATAPSPPAQTAPIARPTVIPVPALPTLQGTSGASPLQPVLRTPANRPPRETIQFAKGTGTVTPGTGMRIAPERSPEMSDDTDPNVSVGDRTTPGIALPKAARTVALRPLSRDKTRRSPAR